MKTMFSIAALILLLAAPGLSDAAVLDVPGSFATIQAGIDTAADGDTVLVAPGIYYENLNLTGKSITLASHYITTGDTMYMHETVIDGSKDGTVVRIRNDETNVTTPNIIGFTIQNGYDNNPNGTDPHFQPGTGLMCYYADPALEYLIIRDNFSSHAGGVYCYRSNPILQNCTITGNLSFSAGGGANFNESKPVLENVTVTGNSASSGGGLRFINCESAKCERMVVRGNSGNAIQCSQSNVWISKADITNNLNEVLSASSSTVTIVNSTLAAYVKYYSSCIRISGTEMTLVNSIIWRSNSPDQIEISNTPDKSPKSFIHITKSDFLGGISSIKGYHEDADINADIYFSDTNITDDPLFTDPYNNDFTLQKNSPCIDKGLAYYELNGETIVSIPESEFIGSAPDIGVYEYNSQMSIEENDSHPQSFKVMAPYPNPFNTCVTIPFHVYENAQFSVSMFNNNGQKISTLFSGFLRTGSYSLKWDATGYASGPYYCTVENIHCRETIRVIYLK